MIHVATWVYTAEPTQEGSAAMAALYPFNVQQLIGYVYACLTGMKGLAGEYVLTVYLDHTSWRVELGTHLMVANELEHITGVLTRIYPCSNGCKERADTCRVVRRLWIPVSNTATFSFLPSTPKPSIRLIMAETASTYIMDHLSEAPTLVSIARALGTNQTHLQRAIREVYGLPVATYCRKLRLERAKQLLIETSQDLERIAISTGYREASGLVTAFRRAFVVPPGKWREEWRFMCNGQKKS